MPVLSGTAADVFGWIASVALLLGVVEVLGGIWHALRTARRKEPSADTMRAAEAERSPDVTDAKGRTGIPFDP